MIRYTQEALDQVTALTEHYETLGRPEAVSNLRLALQRAEEGIALEPLSGLPAPRPYPGVAAPGRLWVKSGRYWFRYTTEPPLTVTAVFYDAADIPRRLLAEPSP